MKTPTLPTVAGCLGLWVVSTLAGCSQPLETPASFERYSAPNKKFSIEYPSNWSAKSGDSRGMMWIEFRQGPAKCTINSNIVTNAMGDIIAGGAVAGRPSDVPDELQPEARLHEFLLQDFLAAYPDYHELETLTIRTRIGRVRVTEFLSSGTRGYRATMILGGDPVTFVLEGPETDWVILCPVFQQMLDSIGPNLAGPAAG